MRWRSSSQVIATRTSSRMPSTWTEPTAPLPLGSHESNLPSSCLNLKEIMKKTHRQKMMSTSAVTLIATGFSSLSPTLTPAMVRS